MGQRPEPPHELMYAVLVYSFSRPAPSTAGTFLPCLPGTESLTIPIHFFHRTSELDAAFKLGSVQLPTPHSNAGFTGKVIVLLKILQWLPAAPRTHSKPSVKACRSGPCYFSTSLCSSHIDLSISSVSPLPLFSLKMYPTHPLLADLICQRFLHFDGLFQRP